MKIIFFYFVIFFTNKNKIKNIKIIDLTIFNKN